MDPRRPTYPPKARPGDRVAILSPSWAGPGAFPAVHERGLEVVRERLGLVPVEYPTTRALGASPIERARDLEAAFADPEITAVLATIGGDDQITVLAHLDPDVLAANPKPFVGYSDNTNLLNLLFHLGIVAYHGGSTLVHLARPGGVHPAHLDSLARALFTRERVALEPLERFSDRQPDWGDLSTLEAELEQFDEPGWLWRNAAGVVTGPAWGGNLEVLSWILAVGRHVRPVEAYRGVVLVLETSEEMPSDREVARMMRTLGERGLLGVAGAVVVAKAKASSPERPLDPEAARAYREAQAATVLAALEVYAPTTPVVIGPDFGHTDPQYVIPYGGLLTLDGPARRLWAEY